MLWHFETFVNTGQYAAGIFKNYCAYSFHLIAAKFYYHSGIQAFASCNWPLGKF